MADIWSWLPLPLPATPDGYEWCSSVWDNGGYPCAEFRLLHGPLLREVGKARIDLEMYGHAAVKSRAEHILAKELAKKPK